MKGRKPLPTRVKELLGNPGKRPLNGREPKYPAGVGKAPDHLDEIARKEWNRVAKLLTAAGVVTAVDRGVLAVYCAVWSRLVRAERKVAEEGEVLKSPAGGMYQNPHLAVANKAVEQIAKLSPMLGLDPSSRSRIVVPAGPLVPQVWSRPRDIDKDMPPPWAKRGQPGGNDADS